MNVLRFFRCSFRRGTERSTSKKLTRKWKALSSLGWVGRGEVSITMEYLLDGSSNGEI